MRRVRHKYWVKWLTIAHESKGILDSLRFHEIDYRHDDISEAYSSTFQWIWRPGSSGFIEWLQSSDGLFWIKGKPGSGKSALMKYIVDKKQMKDHIHRDPGTGDVCLATFFFHNRGTAMQKTVIGLLRSILRQILGTFPRLITYVSAYRSKDRSDLNEQAQSWSLHDLRAALTSLVVQDSIQGYVLLFVDGLDEYNGDHEEIVVLLRQWIARSKGQRLQTKACVSSRPWTVFEQGLYGISYLNVQDLTYWDIRKYVSSKMSEYAENRRLTNRDKSLMEQLVTDIVKKAGGVFLWVRFAVKSIGEGYRDGDRIHELQARLKTLPPDLHGFYQEMLDSIRPS